MPQFIHSTVKEHTISNILVIINKTAIKISQFFDKIHKYYLEIKLLDHMLTLFHVIRNFQNIF